MCAVTVILLHVVLVLVVILPVGVRCVLRGRVCECWQRVKRQAEAPQAPVQQKVIL